MGFSHLVHAGGNVLTSFSVFSTQQKNYCLKLRREIRTLCNELYPDGTIDFTWSAALLDTSLATGTQASEKRLCKYRCNVMYVKRRSFREKRCYFAIFEAEIVMDVRHFWEPFQREPRWEVQNKVLEALLQTTTFTARMRFGDDYKCKMIMKARKQQVVLDEKAAYLEQHAMGGFEAPGRWKYVPPSIEGTLTEEQEYPQISQYSEERYRAWQSAVRDMEAKQLGWESAAKFYPPPQRQISRQRRLPARDGAYGPVSDSEGDHRSGHAHRSRVISGPPVGYGPHGPIYDQHPYSPPARGHFEPYQAPHPNTDGDVSHIKRPLSSQSGHQPSYEAKKGRTHDQSANSASKRVIGQATARAVTQDNDALKKTKPGGLSAKERSKLDHPGKHKSLLPERNMS